MNIEKRPCIVFDSCIGSIPLFGYIFLFIQIFGRYVFLTNKIYLPRKNKVFLPNILKVLDKSVSIYILHTFTLGDIVQYMHKPVRLDVVNDFEYTLCNDQVYSRVLWSLIKCTELSNETIKHLNKFFQQDFQSLF